MNETKNINEKGLHKMYISVEMIFIIIVWHCLIFTLLVMLVDLGRLLSLVYLQGIRY